MVELVLVGEDFLGADHPMHMHGYSFRVVGFDKLARGSTVADVIELDKQGELFPKRFKDSYSNEWYYNTTKYMKCSVYISEKTILIVPICKLIREHAMQKYAKYHCLNKSMGGVVQLKV